MSRTARRRKTVTLSITIGTAEMEMLHEIMKECKFISLSEAVRAIIRHYHEAKKCG